MSKRKQKYKPLAPKEYRKFTEKLITFNNRFQVPNPLLIEKYIDEHRDELIKALEAEEHINIFAPMNSGKTFSLLKLCDQITKSRIKSNIEKLNFVFTVPLNSIAFQTVDKLAKEGIDVGLVHGKYESNGVAIPPSTDEDILQIMDSNKTFIAVYDQIQKIVGLLKGFPDSNSDNHFLKSYIFIIDEAHNLVTQSIFRLKAIQSIIKSSNLFRKVVYVTGTPEGAVYNDFRRLNFKFSKATERKRIEVISYKTDLLKKVVFHILINRINGKKTVLLMDNIESLNKIKDALLDNSITGNSISTENIYVLESQSRSEEFYTEMITEEEIPIDVEFVLTTRVISDGVNLWNENINSVYLVQVKDYLLKRQFLSRLRNGFDIAYDFVFEGTGKFSNTYYDIETRIRDLYSETINKRDVEQNIIDKGIESDYYRQYLVQNYKDHSETQYIFWDSFEEKLFVSKEKINYHLLNKINIDLYSDPNKAIIYYELIAEYDCTISCFEDVYKMDGFKIGSSVDFITNFENYLSAFFYSVKNEYEEKFHKYSNKMFSKSPAFSKEFYESNSSGFTVLHKNLLSQSLDLLRNGMPIEFIKASCDYIIKSSNHMYKDYYEQIKYLAYSDAVRSMDRINFSDVTKNEVTSDFHLLLFIKERLTIDSAYSWKSLSLEIMKYAKTELGIDIVQRDIEIIISGIYHYEKSRKFKTYGMTSKDEYVIIIKGVRTFENLIQEIADKLNSENDNTSNEIIEDARIGDPKSARVQNIGKVILEYIKLEWENINIAYLYSLIDDEESSAAQNNGTGDPILRTAKSLIELRKQLKDKQIAIIKTNTDELEKIDQIDNNESCL